MYVNVKIFTNTYSTFINAYNNVLMLVFMGVSFASCCKFNRVTWRFLKIDMKSVDMGKKLVT